MHIGRITGGGRRFTHRPLVVVLIFLCGLLVPAIAQAQDGTVQAAVSDPYWQASYWNNTNLGAGVLAFVTAAVSVALLVVVDSHAYGAGGLALFACLAGLFFVLELRFARDLGRYQALASVSGLVGPAEQFLGSLMDPDTMLPRFWLFSARLTEEIQRAERHKRTLTLCVLEPDDLTIYLDQTFRQKVGPAVQGHLRGSDSATVDHSGRLLVLFAETSGPEERWRPGVW